MIAIKKRSRNDYNWAVYRDGVHVDALVKLYDDPTKAWVLWQDKEDFTEDEREVIRVRLAELNSSTS